VLAGPTDGFWHVPFELRDGYLDRRGREESAMASQPQAEDWLQEHGPKKLDLLFRALVFNLAVPILLADDDRRYLEASVAPVSYWVSPASLRLVNFFFKSSKGATNLSLPDPRCIRSARRASQQVQMLPLLRHHLGQVDAFQRDRMFGVIGAMHVLALA